jgi:hypothetical protein
LQAGRLGALNSLGALGFLFLSAPSLRTAFTSFSANLERSRTRCAIAFSADGSLATYEYLITDQTLQSRRQDAEFSIAIMHNMCRNYVGGEFELAEVRFDVGARATNGATASSSAARCFSIRRPIQPGFGSALP